LVLLIAAIATAAAVGIDVGVRTGDAAARFKAAFATFVPSVITAGVVSAGLGVVGSVAPAAVDTAKTALSVVGLASGTYGVVEAGRNGMYATAVVGAILLAVAAYSLLTGGDPKAGKDSRKGLEGQQFANNQKGVVLNDAGGGEGFWSDYFEVRPENGDGYLTLGEAKWQWENGKGAPVTVDADKLDLSALRVSDFPRGPGSVEPFALPRWRDFIVHGTVSVRLNPNSTVSILPDRFNFDLKPWSTHFTRNVYTVALRVYVGSGTPFPVHFRGAVTIGP
jgi:hypothetical protein